MFKVYYVYDKVDRVRVRTGFEVHYYHVAKKIGEFETIEEAKKANKFCEDEEKYPKGSYLITKEEKPELEEFTSPAPGNKTKIDKKKKK